MRFDWVDVFATRPLSGNPLAVITGQRFPDDDAMQAMAAEIGLSESVFAIPGDPPELRIFTPSQEIPLAGHPLVGTAWVLRTIGWTADDAVLRTRGGDITVSAHDAGARMVARDPARSGTADAGALARALGAAPTAGEVPVWDAGLPQAMIPVDDPGALQPDHAEVARLGDAGGWAGASAYALRGTHEGRLVAEVRHFAAPIGIAEDPVTGSAAAALGAALADAGHRTDGDDLAVLVRQGHHMGRDGQVLVHVRMAADGVARVTVGGAVVPVITGTVGGGMAAG